MGSELGGKEGGVGGAAIGGAVGSAIATQGQHRDQVVVREVRPTPLPTYYYVDERYEHPHARHFCPPGQAKKGHC